jgi:phosphoglycerate kinase
MSQKTIGKGYLTMNDVVLDNKRVLVRVDFN